MLRAVGADGCSRIAWETRREDKPFFCPACGKEVVICKGSVRAHHFRHKARSSCGYGAGESQAHMITKREIFEAVLADPACDDCQLERWVGGDVRPDVSFRYRGRYIVVEVQKSSIKIEDIKRRMAAYTARKWYTLWVIASPRPTALYDLALWERFLSTMYYGMLYYWKMGRIQVVKLRTVSRTIEATDWGGGYSKAYRYKKWPQFVGNLQFPANFSLEHRSRFATRDYVVPPARIVAADLGLGLPPP